MSFIKTLKESTTNSLIYTLFLFIGLAILSQLISPFVRNFLVRIFITFPLYLLLFTGGIVLVVLSVLYIIKKYKQIKSRSFLPLLLTTLFFFVLINQPFSPISQKAEFLLKLKEREVVATLILNGEIEPSNARGDLFMVPKEYNSSSISDGREVMKLKDKLFFFTVRGILDNFSGYVYSPDGSVPTNNDLQADILEIQKMNKNWYYVSCT